MIKEFQGKYRWLSNFEPVSIRLGNKVFPSVEHAYMSMKSSDSEWKDFCANEPKPGKVKRASKHITLINGWDNHIRLRIMKSLLIMKFSKEPFKTKLLTTGNQNIQEGNNWNDKFFGICLKSGEGENHLGRMIMDIRNDLIKT